MLLPRVYRLRDQLAHPFAQHELLRHAADFLVHRLRRDELDDVVVEKRDAAFYGVRHLHPIAEHREDVAAENGLRPEVERLVQRIPPGQLAADIEVVEDRPRAVRQTVSLHDVARQQRSIFTEREENVSIQDGTYPRTRFTRSTCPIAVGQQKAARHGVLAVEPLEQLGNRRRILPFTVIQQHVAPEVRVPAEHLVRALARDDDLVPGVAHGAAQKVLGDAMGVDAKRLRLGDRVGEIVREIALPDRDRVIVGAGPRGHLLCDRPLVIVADSSNVSVKA